MLADGFTGARQKNTDRIATVHDLRFVIFDNDTRTDPMHGRKLAAALQHASAGSRPILIRAEGDVGHGARSVAKSVEESTTMLGFAAHWTGLHLT